MITMASFCSVHLYILIVVLSLLPLSCLPLLSLLHAPLSLSSPLSPYFFFLVSPLPSFLSSPSSFFLLPLLFSQGHLLLLVTDHGFLNEHGHVWEVLSNIEGDGDFLDATFHWSSHSDLQQKREERAGQKQEGEEAGTEEGEKEEEEAPRQPPADTNLE